jgi:hypothetical protein
MRILRKIQKQWMCYWLPIGVDDNGNRTYDLPIELKVRWEEAQVEFTDMSGKKLVSRAEVYPLEVDLVLDAVCRLGKLDTLSDPSNCFPFTETEAWAIKRFEKTPTLRATQFFRCAFLGGAN